MSNAKHLNIMLLGNVQGVFMRRTIAHKARQLGIFGFVRNEPDTTVYIEAEGDSAKLDLFFAWLKSGAGEGLHTVKEVEVNEGQYKAFEEFKVSE